METLLTFQMKNLKAINLAHKKKQNKKKPYQINKDPATVPGVVSSHR